MKGIVSFYEKPGCKGNAMQKDQLREAGYVVQSVDMIKKEWNSESLLKFFQDDSPHQFVNNRAPQITSGELIPIELSDDELLQAMIDSPILIKRPLLFFRGRFGVGFDCPLVEELLGDSQKDNYCESGENCQL